MHLGVSAFSSRSSLRIPDANRRFPVNVILVVGHEKLNVEMQRLYGDRITVVKIPKSGGVCRNTLLYPASRLTNAAFIRSWSSTHPIANAYRHTSFTRTCMARSSPLPPAS